MKIITNERVVFLVALTASVLLFIKQCNRADGLESRLQQNTAALMEPFTEPSAETP